MASVGFDPVPATSIRHSCWPISLVSISSNQTLSTTTGITSTVDTGHRPTTRCHHGIRRLPFHRAVRPTGADLHDFCHGESFGRRGQSHRRHHLPGQQHFHGHPPSIDSSGNGSITTTADLLPDSGSVTAHTDGDYRSAQNTSAGEATSAHCSAYTDRRPYCLRAGYLRGVDHDGHLRRQPAPALPTVSLYLHQFGCGHQWHGHVQNGSTARTSHADSTSPAGGSSRPRPLANCRFPRCLPVPLPLSAVCNPTDTNQLSTATGTATLTVNPATLTITTNNQSS